MRTLLVRPLAGKDVRVESIPTLLVGGDDAQHPREVSDLYAAALTRVTVIPATTSDPAAAIAAFCGDLDRGRLL